MQESNSLPHQVHIIAQYLAAAAISFIEKKEDDSHTNLGFDTDCGSFYTRDLSSSGDKLSFNLNTFTLEWISREDKATFRLDGASHKSTIEWLQQTSATFLGRPYRYDFHYEIPYEVTDDMVFKLLDMSKMQELLHLRILTTFVLERLVERNGYTAEIRTWPHHFDTGAFLTIDERKKLSIGIGLAVPDEVSATHYFYLSAYKNGTLIPPTDMPKLSIGHWIFDTFKGAIVSAKDLVETEALQFFQEGIAAIKQHYTSTLSDHTDNAFAKA